MISNIIVFTALILAGLYVLCWLLRKDFRQQIEQPKYRFQEQLKHFEGRQRKPPADEDNLHAR